jgi:hypothetical protein
MIANVAAVLGVLALGAAALSARQRRDLVNTLTSDPDVFLLRPLEKKAITVEWEF